MAEADTVVVHCMAPTGLHLFIHEEKSDEYGYKLIRRTGESYRLAAGRNEGVPADFMKRWMEQHKAAPSVLSLVVLEK